MVIPTIFSGKLFRVYTKSHFLDHLARDTGGHTETILHFQVTCLNNLIDVAAYSPPEVRLVGARFQPSAPEFSKFRCHIRFVLTVYRWAAIILQSFDRSSGAVVCEGEIATRRRGHSVCRCL